MVVSFRAHALPTTEALGVGRCGVACGAPPPLKPSPPCPRPHSPPPRPPGLGRPWSPIPPPARRLGPALGAAPPPPPPPPSCPPSPAPPPPRSQPPPRSPPCATHAQRATLSRGSKE
eukprot:1195784-Prorocentrum_minimum.AAC.11